MDKNYIKAMIGAPFSENDTNTIWYLNDNKIMVNLGKDEIFVELDGRRDNHTILTLVYFLSPYRKSHYIPHPHIFIPISLKRKLKYLHVLN